MQNETSIWNIEHSAQLFGYSIGFLDFTSLGKIFTWSILRAVPKGADFPKEDMGTEATTPGTRGVWSMPERRMQLGDRWITSKHIDKEPKQRPWNRETTTRG